MRSCRAGLWTAASEGDTIMDDLVYSPPVDRLLTLGRPEGAERRDWPGYTSHGIGPDDVPQLSRMLRDPRLNDESAAEPEFWAPVHAWRALSQLQALGAIEAMLDALDRRQRWNDYDDWSFEELREVFEHFGP